MKLCVEVFSYTLADSCKIFGFGFTRDVLVSLYMGGVCEAVHSHVGTLVDYTNG